MAKYDIVIIGHVASDILVYKGETSGYIGGGAYFSAFVAKRAGAKFCVVTKLARKDFGILEGLKKEGIEVTALPSPRTTSIENVFETDDVDHRKVQLLSQADPFNPADIPDVDTRIFYLAGLFVGEIPDSLIVHLSQKGEVGLDLQAKLRSSEAGVFSFKDWPDKEKVIPRVTYLKADSLESEVVTGTPDREKAAGILHGLGAKEVMITHSSEVILYDGKSMFRAPFNPTQPVREDGKRGYLFYFLHVVATEPRDRGIPQICSGAHEFEDGDSGSVPGKAGRRLLPYENHGNMIQLGNRHTL